MKQLYEIKNRFTGEVIFKRKCESFRACVQAAIGKKANLSAANLELADLELANLGAANLSGANLSRANLSGANLSGANLIEAEGAIFSFGPIGDQNRIGFAYFDKEKKCVMVRLGCFTGTKEEAIKEIIEKYGENSIYEKTVSLAVEVVEGKVGVKDDDRNP